MNFLTILKRGYKEEAAFYETIANLLKDGYEIIAEDEDTLFLGK